MLHCEAELDPLHRLDCGTEGVVVLGKCKQFAQHFREALRNAQESEAIGQQDPSKSASKHYRALTQVPAPLGALEHWAVQNFSIKKSPEFTCIVSSGHSGGVRCQLVVERVRLPPCQQHNVQAC